MIRAMYNGTSGLLAAQQGLSTTSNNIANSQTTGFKKQDTFFEDVFYQSLKSPSTGNGRTSGTNPADIGNGVAVSTVKTDFATGPIIATGGNLDAAISGSGFFVVGDTIGENRMYTKAGNFVSSINNELVTTNGYYVMGWNADPVTGQVNTTGAVEPIRVPVGDVGMPQQTTEIQLVGNLNREGMIGSISGSQIRTYDSLGVSHDVDVNFMKSTDNTYRYVAVPTDQFVASDTIQSAIFRPGTASMAAVQKGEYKIASSAPNAGMVTITVTAPDGTSFSQDIVNSSQTVNIEDANGDVWFTVDFKPTGTASGTDATVVIGDVGEMEFDPQGNLLNGGEGTITFTPKETGTQMNIALDLTTMTSLATDNNIVIGGTDGYGSSTLMSYSITDGGQIQGEYNDGSVRVIGQLATAVFANELGLTREGSGLYKTTPNSGEPDIGLPGTGQRGDIKSQALENSNVDLAEEFVNLISMQKFYQGNGKVITVTQDVLDTTINLIR